MSKQSSFPVRVIKGFGMFWWDFLVGDTPEIFVAVGICTHLGCSPGDKFTPGAQPSLPADWPGGWLCPCHGSTFDLAGRVFKNKPAPDNLRVPPYKFLSDSTLLIGEDKA